MVTAPNLKKVIVTEERNHQLKLNLSKQAFWDVDMYKIDYEHHVRFVISKIVDRGLLEILWG